MAREEQVTPWNLCPRCNIPHDPNNPDARTMRTCCGRMICRECQLVIGPRPCPYCAEPAAKNVEEIRARLQRHVDNEVPEALYYVARCHGFGDFGFDRSDQKWGQMMARAAKLGHLDALYQAGIAHLVPHQAWHQQGAGHQEEAMQLWQLAAAQGHARALCKLGKIARLGRAAKDRFDHAEAKQFFTRAAAQGLAEAEFELAGCLIIDRNSCSDLDEKSRLSEEVWRLLGRAAAHGHPKASSWLKNGVLDDTGKEAFFERHDRDLQAAYESKYYNEGRRGAYDEPD